MSHSEIESSPSPFSSPMRRGQSPTDHLTPINKRRTERTRKPTAKVRDAFLDLGDFDLDALTTDVSVAQERRRNEKRPRKERTGEVKRAKVDEELGKRSTDIEEGQRRRREKLLTAASTTEKRRHCEISDSERSPIRQRQRQDLQFWTQRNRETYDKTSLTLLTDELRRIGQRLTRIETVLEPINTMKERLERVEAGVGKMTGLLEMMVNSGGSGGVVSKCDTEQTFKVGSDVHLLRLQGATPYSWALHAVSVLFTKEELSSSLLFKSKKSNKPALDHERVERLLSLMGQKYPQGEWNMQALQQRINQKCRDTKVPSPRDPATSPASPATSPASPASPT